ncbi:MAG: AbrB/MazE/SpoVT family DNA-binding domain-containing protein [Nitrososphaerota archaeon]|nr:AbrB/MazE/SpoVT family DNA-binding domain-containing protein [Nitrososphaerota archaeon]MDG7025708.1 AbrB/MazE/SpoVT family DNA-binding domain-containing protein [Nitrososphaerota archaeon]
MTETSTVTSKSMVNIPASIRKKYGIHKGDKLAFVETEHGLTVIRIPPLSEVYGSGVHERHKIIQAIHELETEHRGEAHE